MTIDEFRAAGKVVDSQMISDEELTLAINATARVLAYLHGRGQFFGLASSRIAQDLSALEGFRIARKAT